MGIGKQGARLVCNGEYLFVRNMDTICTVTAIPICILEHHGNDDPLLSRLHACPQAPPDGCAKEHWGLARARLKKYTWTFKKGREELNPLNKLRCTAEAYIADMGLQTWSVMKM